MLQQLFGDMNDSYKIAPELQDISKEVRDDSFIKVMDNGTISTQEDRALMLMYGENVTNHQLSRKLNIPITSATRVTHGMCHEDKLYAFSVEKVFNEDTKTQNTVYGLTTLGKKRGYNLLWQSFQSKKVGQ